jgi:hypothetical protein
MAMNGLSQAELDALCCQGPAEEPSSPLGGALLARKRSRQARRQPDGESARAMEALAQAMGSEASNGDGIDAETGGLTQAALNALSVEMELPQDPTSNDSSPVGSALRRIKNRRCWGSPAKEDAATEMAQATNSNEEAIATPLRCPASWGSGGLSQAELDSMCAGEAATSTDVEPPVAIECVNVIVSEPKEEAVVTAFPDVLSPQLLSPQRPRRRVGGVVPQTGSSPRQSRTQRQDENLGSPSPNKAIELNSPGLGDSKVMSMSPQRRPRMGASPLSPALLN